MQILNLKNNLAKIIFAAVTSLFLLTAPLQYSALAGNSKEQSVTKNNPSAENLLPAKKENKNIFGKFLKSMVWVGASCVVIYVILLLYRRSKGVLQADNLQYQDISKDLNSPLNTEDAVEFVIKKF